MEARSQSNHIALHWHSLPFVGESVSTFLFWYGFFLLPDKCVA